jgi:hypothetical protein
MRQKVCLCGQGDPSSLLNTQTSFSFLFLENFLPVSIVSYVGHEPVDTGAELDDRDTFLGLGANRLVRWDQRVSKGVVQEMASPIVTYAGGKDYARNTNFSCMATSGASV